MSSPNPLLAGTRWAILCRVIDNYGDAGVCWRLARQLAREYGARVTLLIDRSDLVERFAGHAGPYAGIDVRRWPADATPPSPAGASSSAALPFDVIVSAFGCEPPVAMRAALAGAPARPLWIDLEYLSAEPWVDECHGLVSVKPFDGAVQTLFCPGFTPTSGGLLRERDALAALAPRGDGHPDALQRMCGGITVESGERVVTLFCYPQAPVATWLAALVGAEARTLVLVPEGVAQAAIEQFAGRPLAPGDTPLRSGGLRLARIPFLPQDDYDRLLRLADLNFVRGEDSWIRAHWAQRPFVWQPYPQDDRAHLIKLEAFLARMQQAALPEALQDAAATEALRATAATEALRATAATEALRATAATEALRATAATEALRAAAAMMRAWSGNGDPIAAWAALEGRAIGVAAAFRRWVDFLLAQHDLARNLAQWAARKL